MNTELPFFPQPAHGETVHSLLCRFLERSRLPYSRVFRTFTGINTKSSGDKAKFTVSATLPGYLPQLTSILPKGHPWKIANDIVVNHTTLPYFTYFDTPEERIKWIVKLTQTETIKPLCSALGIRSFRRGAKPPTPQFCRLCIEEQIKTLGYTYFRREHQLPGVVVCWEHGTILSHGCKICGPYPIKTYSFSMPGKCRCSQGTTDANINFDIPLDLLSLQWIAKQSAYMVNSEGTRWHGIRDNLRKQVLAKGYCLGNKINLHRLAKALENRFGSNTLEWLGAQAWENGKPAAWLGKLLYASLDGHRRSPAIYFLLVIGTTFESIEAFEKSTLPAPMNLHEKSAAKPWSDQLDRLINIDNTSADRLLRKINATRKEIFNELHQKNWKLPLTPEAKERLGSKRINGIRSDLRSEIVYREICHRNGCTDWTINLVILDNPELYAAHKKVALHRSRDKYRKCLEDHLKHQPGASRSDIAKDLPNVYEYLIKKDKEWFYKQIPKRKAGIRHNRKYPRDWQKLDQQSLEKVEKAFEEIISLPGKPTRATPSAILKRCKLNYTYNNHREKLPKTAATIKNLTESCFEYLERTMRWGNEQIAKPNMPISAYKLSIVTSISLRTIREHERLLT